MGVVVGVVEVAMVVEVAEEIRWMTISSILVNCGPLDCVIPTKPSYDAWRRRWCCEGTLRVITANLGQLYGRRQRSMSSTTLSYLLVESASYCSE
jgi:hypothetical protein